MNDYRERPSYRLTRHFFQGLFDFGFLSDTGVASFTRMVLGICAFLLAQGLLLLRVFIYKYTMLAGQTDPRLYRLALPADHAFLIGIPMWIVGVVTVLTGHALFPDVTDFRILSALPVTRRLIFTSKVGAVVLFASIFIVAAHVGLFPVTVLIAANRWAGDSFVVRLLAFEVVSLLGSVFVVAAVIAIHGLLVVLWPRGATAATSAALRSVMLCALIVACPFVLRLTIAVLPFSREAPWLLAAPPAWFVGLERWIMGESSPYYARLAAAAIGGLGLSIAVAGASYAFLYRRFRTLAVRAGELGRPGRVIASQMWWRWDPRPARAAVGRFVVVTMARSVLHQGMFAALTSIGIGIAVSSLASAGFFGWAATGGVVPAALADSTIWSTAVLTFSALFSARSALLVPVETRANWIFRVVEQTPDRRVDQLDGAAGALVALGVALPALIMLPIQIAVFGARAPAAIVVSLLIGWLVAEIITRDWARIPFTCSYIPGKTFIPQLILKGILTLVLFKTVAGDLVRTSLTGEWRAALIIAVLASGILVMRHLRLRAAASRILEFEDELPNDIQSFALLRD